MIILEDQHIVPIPKTLIFANTFMIKNIRMLDEIEEWCSTELTGKYVLNYAATPFRKEWNMPYQIVFENATDAILFKLRWL